jgi:hypothetical protein
MVITRPLPASIASSEYFSVFHQRSRLLGSIGRNHAPQGGLRGCGAGSARTFSRMVKKYSRTVTPPNNRVCESAPDTDLGRLIGRSRRPMLPISLKQHRADHELPPATRLVNLSRRSCALTVRNGPFMVLLPPARLLSARHAAEISPFHLPQDQIVKELERRPDIWR